MPARWSPTDAATLTPAVIALAGRQHRVLSRRQLTDLGVGPDAVAAQVRARRWRVSGRAVVLHRGPLTVHQRRWVAVLDHAPGSVALAAWTALEHHGLEGWARREIHVVVAKSVRVRRAPGLVVHESRRFDPDRDVVVTRGIPTTDPARSAIDAAAWTRSARSACGLLLAVVQQRLATPEALADALDAAGRVRHARLMRRTIADAAGGADSLAELDMTALLRRAGLPPPRRQVVRPTAGGRRRYVDVETRLPDGTPLEIEVDGSVHLDVAQWWADQQRHNETASAGAVRLRVPVVAIRTDPDGVVDQLVRVRRRHEPARP